MNYLNGFEEQNAKKRKEYEKKVIEMNKPNKTMMFKVIMKRLTNDAWREKFPSGAHCTGKNDPDSKPFDVLILSPIDNLWYSANTICKSQSNRCSYGDIMTKCEDRVQLTKKELIQHLGAKILQTQKLIDMGCDYTFYGSLLENYKAQLNNVKNGNN